MFPDGMSAMAHTLAAPLATHCKYFAPNNEYQKMGFRFMVEEKAAYPLDVRQTK